MIDFILPSRLTRNCLKDSSIFFVVALSILFWPIILLLLAAVGASLGRPGQALLTSAPIVVILLHLGYLLIYRSFTAGIVRFKWWLLCAYFFGCSLVLSFAISLFKGEDFTDALSAFKTIGQFPAILLWAILIFDSIEIRKNIAIADWFFSVCLIPAGFIIIETVMKIVTPSLMDYIYNLSELAEFGGANYLAYGDLDYGLLQGARPLGFYFDMMTSATVAFMAGIYFAWRKSYLKLVFAFLSVLLSFRLTIVLSFIPILGLLMFPKAYKVVAGLLIGAGLALLPVLYNYFNQINSSSIILEHLTGHLFELLDRPYLELLFGSGWVRSEESVVGYSEVFIYRFFEYFGIVGIVAIVFLILRPIFVGFYSRRYGIQPYHSDDKLLPGVLAMSIGFSCIPLVIHYNLLFIGPVVFQFVIMLIISECHSVSAEVKNPDFISRQLR